MLAGQRRRGRLAAGGVAIVLFLGGSFRTASHVAAAMPCQVDPIAIPGDCLTADQASFFAALRAVRAELPLSSVFLTAKSGALYTYTGRRSVPYHGALAQARDRFVPFLKEKGATHVLLTALEQSEPRGLLALLRSNCGALSIAGTFPPRTYLFRLSPEVKPAETGNACAALDAYATATAIEVERD
jgi:hypothetical protein